MKSAAKKKAAKRTAAPAGATRKSARKTQGRAGDVEATSNLGALIRRLRRAKGWKLTDLSEHSGIAVSTLSKVENGRLSLSYDRLQQAAHAFDMSLSEFLAEDSAGENSAVPTGRISWARKGSGSQIETDAYVNMYLCEGLRKKAMVPIRAQCLARSLEEFGPLLKHEGEEFVLVVKGRVEVHTEYYEPEILEEGEGVYIDSRMGHAYLNAGKGEAWIVSVNSQGVSR